MSGNLVGELLTLCRTGRTELVRENAYQLLLKLAGDGVRGGARRECINRARQDFT
jgi:hypothetical protein